MVVLQPSHLSTLNSSTTPLGANATFTGTAEDVLNYANIQLNVKASHTSATNGLKIQFSPDGANWDNDDSYTIEAGVGKTFSAQTSGRYFRVVYVNGATPQTYFRLETIAKPQYTKPSSHRLKDNVSTEDDAELVKAQLVAQMPSGTMTNINSTTGGNLKVSVEESDPNATLIVKPYLIDEFGNTAQMLGDNYYQGSPIVIDVEHHEIHCGDSYRAIRKVDLGNGASDNILITVPNETGTELTQKKYHLTIQLDTELEADYSFYEAPTTTANGTAMTFYNRNRNSAFTTGLTIHHTPTVTADGTLLDGDHWGSGRNAGGAQRGELEWVLKNNTKYLLRITNSTSNNNYISWKIDHYIHPGV